MQNRTNSLKQFGGIVSQALTETFREFCTFALEAAVVPTESALLPAEQDLVCFSINLEGSLQGRGRLAVKKKDISVFGLRDVPTTEEAELSALLRLLQTTASRLQGHAANRYDTITASVEQTAGPVLPNSETLEIHVNSEEGDTQTTLYFSLEPQLVTALQRFSDDLFPEAAPGGQAPVKNLGLVLDVELNATLRFGQRQLTLREILDLTSGSVVELDRQVDEPVELVLDGRVIARGEAVIIDGNYGMRITEILQFVHGVAGSR